MHNHITTRWAGRMRPCLEGLRATRFGSGLETQWIYRSRTVLVAQRPSRFPIPKRHFSYLPARQNQESRLQSSDASSQAQEPPRRQQSTHKSWVLFNVAGLSAVIIAAVVLKSASSSDGDKRIINKTSFSPFTIVSKEQVSPTAFILSVRPGNNVEGGGGSAQAFREAWDHGLWSVEIKQPQLQIARHYTPLPPLSAHESASSQNDEVLRFLVRKVDGGEMSTYLSKLRVGDAVWLRGPHLGFDIKKRLGDAGRRVVFVAGGTGIAPALQVAQRLLDAPTENADGEKYEAGKKPTVSILWANRRADDALGRQQQASSSSGGKSWFSGWWRRGDETPPGNMIEQKEMAETSFAQQIRDLERRHPGRFRVSYFVDEKGSFIGAQDLRATLIDGRNTPSTPQQPLPPAKTCAWHSPTALAKFPDDDDASRRDTECKCIQKSTQEVKSTNVGANLICVSGPDGFIEAYAGPKRWYAGTEMQGPVRGVLGRMLADGDRPEVEGNWLVLKL
ncbi:hypothetical protein GGR53DRAFT_402791 [Hypoxylon sp. FL1150]|nr:hypothetical protein GGR53DRAFT_402791 [Hypoxylon sp. FL1150]